MAKIIKHQLFFPHPPAVVWEYLTDAELMAQWLMKNNFLPVLGHEFQFRINPMPQFNFDGIVHCKVLAMEPCKTLSYSWNWGPGNGELVESEVNWTLTEKDNGTELDLVHRGFKGVGFMPMVDAMDTGWLQNMHKILKALNAATDGTAKV
jgi:uncharacterized protein YndB with AHSA1/START domain